MATRTSTRKAATPGQSSSPFAVVTGASSGIGLELAKQLAEHGYDLLITAEDAELDDAAKAVKSADGNGAVVRTLRVDLSNAKGVEKLHKRIQDEDRPVDVLALNAGRGEGGDFARDTHLEHEMEIVDLNVRSVVHLTKLELPAMIDRGEGKILFTSSVASSMPGAFQAVYNASKSFVQSFGLALRNELKDTGVSLTLLMPGPTDTEFFDKAHMQDTKVGADEKDDPAQVARQGLDALLNEKERVVGGSPKNKFQVLVGRFMPDRAKAELHRKMAEPGSGD